MEQMDYEIDLIECLQILGKRKWLILTLVMVSALSAYIISANMTKIYSSSCKVMVIPQSACRVNLSSGSYTKRSSG